jgi:hypothetical protein
MLAPAGRDRVYVLAEGRVRMKKLFIAVTLAIGILGIVLQFWIAYIYFYEPYYEDDNFNHSLHVFECIYTPTIK